MNLQEFIHKTLVEIACGVHEARVDVKDLVSIAPGTLKNQPYDGKTDVEFDVALTIQEKKVKDGGASIKIEPVIKVLGASIGGSFLGGSLNLGKEKSNEQVQRVNFKIPIILNAHHRNDKNFDDEGSIVKNVIQKINGSD